VAIARSATAAGPNYPETGRALAPSERRVGFVLAAIAFGGALGSTARYGLSLLLPHPPDHIAWSTIAVNLTGAFLLGLLMVFVNDVWPPSRYVRPFLGVGVLGGYTTFSTFAQEGLSLVDARDLLTAVAYIGGSVVLGIVAVYLGQTVGRAF